MQEPVSGQSGAPAESCRATTNVRERSAYRTFLQRCSCRILDGMRSRTCNAPIGGGDERSEASPLGGLKRTFGSHGTALSG